MKGGSLAIDEGPRGGFDDALSEARALGVRSTPAESAALEALDFHDFRAVYDRYFHETKRWLRALGIPASELDDLAQEVFLVVRRKQAAFDGRNLPGWLFRIAQRTASDHRRRGWLRRFFGGRTEALPETFEWSGPSPVENLERAQARRELGRALSKMSEKVRTAFVLFELEGYDGREVAALLGVADGTAWTRLRHGRRIFLEHCAELAARREKEGLR